MTGTVVKVRGLKQYRHPKTGILYTYHRATGSRIKASPGTAEFFLELAELERQAKARAEEAARPGTLKALIISYKGTDLWANLAPRTKSDYERVFAFLEPLHNAPVISFTPPEIAKLRDRWRKDRGVRFVNYVRTVLIVVLNRAVELGIIDDNPAKKVRPVQRDRDKAPMNRPWTAKERRAVWLATGTRRYRHLRLPFALGLYTGLREGDVLRMQADAIQGGRIRVLTRKRQVPVLLPILPPLARALAAADRSEVYSELCLSSRGTPWTEAGFRASWFKMIGELRDRGIVGEGITFHGLRHTVASVLAEHGAGNEDIAAVLGQRSSRVAAHYADKADRSRRSAAIMGRLLSTQAE